MKALILVGSYRKRGNTAGIAGMVAQALQALPEHPDQAHETAVEVETVYLGHRDIRPCRGCRVCFDRGEDHCPLKDDLPAIYAKMEAADGLVIASPVYVNDVNGITKNWIDRLAFVCHRPRFAGKCATLIATVGDSPTGHTLRTLDVPLRTWGYHIVGQSGFKMGALMEREEMARRYQGRAEAIARRLYHAVRERRYTRPSFVSLMTFKIQQLSWRRAAEDSLDYAYWQGRGWIEPGREFFIPHRANRVKVAAARLAGAVLARFMI